MSATLNSQNPANAATPHREITTPLLLVLALLSAVAPFATDLYLPAFPAMTGDLERLARRTARDLSSLMVVGGGTRMGDLWQTVLAHTVMARGGGPSTSLLRRENK